MHTPFLAVRSVKSIFACFLFSSAFCYALVTPLFSTSLRAPRNSVCPVTLASDLNDGLHKCAIPPNRFKPESPEITILRGRVNALERLVGQLCGALLYSDDMSVIERQTAEVGLIYRDSSFQECRNPVFARKKIEEVLLYNGYTATPFPFTWKKIDRAPNFTVSNVSNNSSNITNYTKTR